MRYGPLVALSAGFVIWSSAFVVLYGLAAVGCAFGWDRATVGPVGALRATLLAAWIAHVAAVGLLILHHCRRGAADGEKPEATGAFIARAAGGIHVMALLSTIWLGLPLLSEPLCF